MRPEPMPMLMAVKALKALKIEIDHLDDSGVAMRREEWDKLYQAIINVTSHAAMPRAYDPDSNMVISKARQWGITEARRGESEVLRAAARAGTALKNELTAQLEGPIDENIHGAESGTRERGGDGAGHGIGERGPLAEIRPKQSFA